MKIKLPIGLDRFEKIRKDGLCYIDKMMFIANLLYNWREVNLFMCLRHFGKALNMSMMNAFFEISCEKHYLTDLKFLKNELFEAYLGQFPVIFQPKRCDGSNPVREKGAPLHS